MSSRNLTALGAVMAEQGRRQDWLAARAGYTTAHVNRLVLGRTPMTRQAAERLAPILGVSVECLLMPEIGSDITPILSGVA